MKEIAADLALYGFGLSNENNIILKNGNVSGLRVSKKGPRLHVRNRDSGVLYFSGAKIGPFLEKFWYAKKLA